LESEQKRSTLRVRITGLIGVVVSVLGLWYALHDVSLRELIDNARQIRTLPFFAAMVAATLAFPLRTIRWRYLLQLNNQKLPFRPLWHATAIGFMANNILPARAGELARVYAAGRLTGVSYSASLASIAIERVFDGIVILALMGIALLTTTFPGDLRVGGIPLLGVAKSIGPLFLVILVVAMVAVRNPERSVGVADRLAHALLPDRWAEKAIGVARGLLAGLGSLKDPKRLLGVVFWSFAVWIVSGISFWFAFIAFDIDVPVSGAFVLLAVIAFGVAVPQAPGYVGVFEAAIKGTLLLYSIEAARSVAYAMLYHVGGFIPITILGLYSLSRAKLHLADLTRAKGTEQ
jgi:glycosyltransferase 2 family protein